MNYFLRLVMLHHQNDYYNIENKFAKYESGTCSAFILLCTQL